MIELPKDKLLPIHKLASVFNDTTNSYKFYWFNAILNALKRDQQGIFYTSSLFDDMLDQVWYPLTFYKLSFGKSDSFKKIAEYIDSCISIDNSPNSPTLAKQLEKSLTNNQQEQLRNKLTSLNRWVPYRFIRPFFHEETTGLPDGKVNNEIEKLAKTTAIHAPTLCPYFILEDKICLNEPWKEYFINNIGILQGFIYWHLTNFIQKNNPNTIGISKKLFKPIERNLGNYRKAWEAFYDVKGSIKCIYSLDDIPKKFSLDHYIPWSFVVHDLNWNLLPVRKEINSSKSDIIPNMQYIHKFVNLQYDFFHIVVELGEHRKIIEEYSLLFNASTSDIKIMPQEEFVEKFKKVMNPMIQIATNMGFKTGWVYGGK